MNCDLLLEWMTHLGSGPWGAFRDAVDVIADPRTDIDEKALYRRIRVAFSDLGHVDFFVSGTRRWQVRRPALAVLDGGIQHLFVGGRTRLLVHNLERAATSAGVVVTTTESIYGPSRIAIEGDPATVRIIAKNLDIKYLSHIAADLTACTPRVSQTIASAERVSEPVNWIVRSWSFADATWVPGRIDRTVREYSNRYGQRRHLLTLGGKDLREVGTREAIYCAAFLRGIGVVRYSASERRLHVPRWAPLPEAYARAACLAGGSLAKAIGGDLVYNSVDPRIALVLLVSLGQGYPMLEARP